MIAEQHAVRRSAVLEDLGRAAPEGTGLLVSASANVRYLTGFTGSHGSVLLGRTAAGDQVAVLGTDGRYDLQAERECPDLPRHLDRASVPALAAVWAALSPGAPLAIEADAMPVSLLRVLESLETPAILETRGIVEARRAIKDDGEIEVLERAGRIAVEAWEVVRERVSAGSTEIQIAREIEAAMLDRGADAPAFATIAAGGPHSAFPHHRPVDRALEPGDLLVLDFGARVDGYHSDMTRTAVVGRATGWHREIHEAVREAQDRARRAIRPGIAAAGVDGVAREVLTSHGLADRFVHGLGHGVGLEIHEAPMIGASAAGMLAAGSVITVEPGVYLPERGGVRIEDVVVVESAGARTLTEAERELIELG